MTQSTQFNDPITISLPPNSLQLLQSSTHNPLPSNNIYTVSPIHLSSSPPHSFMQHRFSATRFAVIELELLHLGDCWPSTDALQWRRRRRRRGRLWQFIAKQIRRQLHWQMTSHSLTIQYWQNTRLCSTTGRVVEMSSSAFCHIED